MRLTVAGPSADEAVRGLLARYPALAGICALEPRPAELGDARFQRGELFLKDDGSCDVTRVYVTLASESDSLAAAMGVHGNEHTARIPVVVALADEQSGIALALSADGQNFGRGIEPFGVLTAALTPALLLQGMNELIARAKHEDYLREQIAAGVTDDESLKPWSELPESLRDSNRRFADGVGSALEAAGCVVAPAPLIDADSSRFLLSDDEVEDLAKREHDRWVRDLTLDGWRPTTGAKDPRAKLHPLLVPWDELSESEREKDRQPMRDLPKMLARQGFEIYRPGSSRTARTS